MKKLIIILLLSSFFCKGQEVGYIGGFSKEVESIQPVYGISMNIKFKGDSLKSFLKYIQLETNLLYSQRSLNNKIQADYLQFMAIGKVGYFGNKIGIYGGYGFSLNPTINHSGGENHTYGSFIPCIGINTKLFNRTYLDIKGIYDCGLSGGYYKNNSWYEYRGFIIMSSIRFTLRN